MNAELIAGIEYLQREKGIDKEVLIEAIEQALLQASKKSVGPARDLRIEIDRKTGEIRALAKLLVVENVANKNDEISLTDARRRNPNIQLGEEYEIEVTPANFGRIAIIAAPVDGYVQLPALALYRRGGSVVGINSLLYGVEACAAMLEQFGRFFDEGLLPLPEGLFESPLAEGLERYAEVNQGSGEKVILLP